MKRTPPARYAGFAKRLKAIMAERGMTQSDVAAKIWGRTLNAKGASVAKGRDRLSVWLNGLSFPSRKNLELLARAFNIQVSDLASADELKARAQPSGWSASGLEGGLVHAWMEKDLLATTWVKIQALLVEDEELQRKP